MSVNDVSEWIKFAEGDIRTAEWTLKDDAPSCHTICFLCQSAAEKYLKALLISKGWKLKKDHDLVFLANILGNEFGIDSSKILECLIVLNDYIVESRYPGEIPFEMFDITMAKEALDAVKKIKDWVKKHYPSK